jgi:CheY-like chemotaxis protein
VELHGGSIQADSAGPNQGSTFTVRLPLSKHAAKPSVPAAAAPASARLRMVVVDDNQDAAETLAMALDLFGCDVTVAHSAAQALDILPGATPSVVLLDIGLPDMNGYELARRVRQLPGGPAMTLIATTGWGQQKDRERAFEAGFDHHLTKPVDFEMLRSLLLGVNPA